MRWKVHQISCVTSAIGVLGLSALAHGEADRGQLKLLWVAYGKTDIAHDNAQAMLQMFDRHQLHYTAHESQGGHTWTNWCHYLSEFAPLLFK
jgi:hypothetical protein